MEILVKNLTKSFKDVKAINNLSLSIKEGITGLIGQNGAGKSTLLRLISGILRPDYGEISIDGHPSESKEAKERVFFLPDAPYSPNGANIESLLSFYGCFYDIDRAKFDGLLAKTTLDKKRRINDFSKGMQRQCFLLLALSVKCPIILIDEGFDGLDPLILEIVKEELIELESEGKTVLLSSHNLMSLERMANQFILLSKGELGKKGSEEDFSMKLVKYQAAFKNPLSKEDLEKRGLKVVSYKRIGQVINFVIVEDDEKIARLNETEKPLILEKIPLETNEIFASQMLLADKGKGGVKDE